MNRYHRWLWTGALWGFLNSSALGATLAPYLFQPVDLPSECQLIQGSYPIDQKIALLYDDKTYRTVLPPMVDRHAQSFQCGTQKGTLYFFLYSQPSEADTSELFARGIFSHLTPVPVIRDFPNGFVVLSFQDIPPSLEVSLDHKIKGTMAPQIIASSITPVTPMTAASSTPTVSSVVVSKSSQAAVVVMSSPVAPAGAVPVPVPVPVPIDDLSQEVSATLLKELDCRAKDLDEDVRETCELLASFNKGKGIDPTIPEPSARIGVTYDIDSFGQMDGRFYTALVGSGRPGEVALVPLFPVDGVEDLEMQALITARRQGQILPASNEIAMRLQKHKRPAKTTLLATQGVSRVINIGGGRKGYLRSAGTRWILIIVTGENPAQQTSAHVVIAGLY